MYLQQPATRFCSQRNKSTTRYPCDYLRYTYTLPSVVLGISFPSSFRRKHHVHVSPICFKSPNNLTFLDVVILTFREGHKIQNEFHIIQNNKCNTFRGRYQCFVNFLSHEGTLQLTFRISTKTKQWGVLWRTEITTVLPNDGQQHPWYFAVFQISYLFMPQLLAEPSLGNNGVKGVAS